MLADRCCRHSSVDLTVILPTRGRAQKLIACLQRLADQTLSRERFEVLVGLDGPDEESAAAVAAVAGGAGLPVRAIPGSREGVAGVKNRLLREARGSVILSINDDVLPEPSFLAAHLTAQRQQDRLGRPAMILGDSPWVVHRPDRLFDRLIRETSMVFFYDQMRSSPAREDEDHDWGYRHAWNLNLSAPADAVREAGGFNVFPCPYGYEDLDLAWRLHETRAMPVLFRPLARADHDHRYDPDGYLLREAHLGYAALGFARGSPGCARAVFGRDVAAADELAYSREFVRRERSLAQRLATSLRATALAPAAEADGVHGPAFVRALYESHLPLKRFLWRVGLIAAFEGEPLDSVTLHAAGLAADPTGVHTRRGSGERPTQLSAHGGVGIGR